MGRTFVVRWLEGEASGYTDLIPLDWFRNTGHATSKRHEVIGPRLGRYMAQCEISVHELLADLNYSAFPEFNSRYSMDLGIMRLTFLDSNRDTITGVLWSSKGTEKFEPCQTAISVQHMLTHGNSNLTLDDIDWAMICALEGSQYILTHLKRERDPLLAKRKKQAFQKEHGKLFCELCGSDHMAVYGPSPEIFEVHHKTPIAAGVRVVKLIDLAILCANCHRTIHRADHTLTFDELKEQIRGRV